MKVYIYLLQQFLDVENKQLQWQFQNFAWTYFRSCLIRNIENVKLSNIFGNIYIWYNIGKNGK